jgi:hypothetical protein
MLTWYGGFDSAQRRNALERILQRDRRYRGTIASGIIERLLQQKLRHKGAYPVMDDDEPGSVWNLLQAVPDRCLTRCPTRNHTTHFPQAIALYDGSLAQGTLLLGYHYPHVIYSAARLEHGQRAC